MGQVVVVGLDIAKPVFRCTALIATVDAAPAKGGVGAYPMG
jgi:hypothetical protein